MRGKIYRNQIYRNHIYRNQKEKKNIKRWLRK